MCHRGVNPGPVAEGAPPPDPAGARELEALAAPSTKDEGELVKEAQVGSAPPILGSTDASAAGPQTFSLEKGQSLDQVQAAMGPPTTVIRMGTKSLYYFGDTKVTIVGGKVTNVE